MDSLLEAKRKEKKKKKRGKNVGGIIGKGR